MPEEPEEVSVIMDNSHLANVIGIDKQVFVDGVGTMTTPYFPRRPITNF